MNKRIEQKKKRSEVVKDKLKKVLAIFFCISLLILSVKITDMSTRRMIMCNDDKYAMAVTMQGDNLLRLDIVGEKYMIDISPAITMSEYMISGSKRNYERLLKTIRSKLDE